MKHFFEGSFKEDNEQRHHKRCHISSPHASANTNSIIHKMLVITPGKNASLVAPSHPYQPSKLSKELFAHEIDFRINDATSFTFQVWHKGGSSDVKMQSEPADERTPTTEQIMDKFCMATSEEDVCRALLCSNLCVKRKSWDPLYE